MLTGRLTLPRSCRRGEGIQLALVTALPPLVSSSHACRHAWNSTRVGAGREGQRLEASQDSQVRSELEKSERNAGEERGWTGRSKHWRMA